MKHSVVVLTHPECLRHRPGIGHPESPDRLRAVLAGVPPDIPILEAPSATAADFALVHDPAYVESIREGSAAGGMIRTDPDTVLSPGTWPAACRAAGAMREAIDRVMNRRADRAFCAVRPPGHHAEKAHTKGFCFFNTMAIGARILQREYGVQRIAIIDWDAHHGNGTQAAFYDDPGVLYVSLHQFPLFPGSGRRLERGTGAGTGTTLNLPLAPGSTDVDVHQAFVAEVEPAVTAFAPDVILLSAGFDGHIADRLAALMLTEQGYADMTRQAVRWADRFAEGRVISLFEGGYDRTALTACTTAHLQALRGDPAR